MNKQRSSLVSSTGAGTLSSAEVLLVRACKSENPFERLHSVYRRFYMSADREMANFYLAGLLTKIVQEHASISLAELISDLHPDNRWKCGVEPEETYWSAVVKILCTHIRLTSVDRFPGFVIPLSHRKTGLAA